jgi:hypothetical protein
LARECLGIFSKSCLSVVANTDAGLANEAFSPIAKTKREVFRLTLLKKPRHDVLDLPRDLFGSKPLQSEVPEEFDEGMV